MPEEKPFGAKTRTNNELNLHIMPSPGFEPGPHWWEASAPCSPKVSTYKRFNCKTFSKSHTCFLLSLSLSFSLSLSLLLSLSLSFSLSRSLDLSLSLSLSPLPVLDSFFFPSLVKVMEIKNSTNNLKQLHGHQVIFLMPNLYH